MAKYQKKSGRHYGMDKNGGRVVWIKGDVVDFSAEEVQGPMRRFIDQWELVEGEEDPMEATEVAVTRYTVVGRGGGWYDVVDLESGEALNDRPLRKTEAESLAEVTED